MTFNRTDFYDAELGRHNERFRAALDIGRSDRVLDIGCGAGRSTRDAARAAVEGSVIGVDISEEMLAVARQRSDEEGLRNIAFELDDAQHHAFPSAHFDLCISRFGTMFFADPPVAFANIARAMRADARLVFMVWQARDRNEWSTAIQGALAEKDVPDPDTPAAFSLGDPASTTELLTAAGFASIDFAEVHEPVFYGPDVEAALEAIIALFLANDGSAGANAATEATHLRLRTMVQAHLTPEGVLFDSCAWIVSARRTQA